MTIKLPSGHMKQTSGGTIMDFLIPLGNQDVPYEICSSRKPFTSSRKSSTSPTHTTSYRLILSALFFAYLVPVESSIQRNIFILVSVPITVQQLDFLKVDPLEDPLCRLDPSCSKSSIITNGCDPGSQSCHCQQGYVLQADTCVDENECLRDDNVCGIGASCENLIGSFRCQCQDGFYHQEGSCRACSLLCSDDSYEVSPCSAYSDRICARCSQCSHYEYEVKPCGVRRNRVCVSVIHPMVLPENKSVDSFIEGFSKTLPVNRRRKRLHVEASSNIFLENLHNTRHMDTTYYVTDMKQLTDFFWFRESGIRINIGLQNINVIPMYEDVDHRSDNDFEMAKPNMAGVQSEEKLHFAEVVRKYCRNPIPDHYSITLEIAKDRATQAKTAVCTLENYRKGACPPGVYAGDQFINRSLNEPCEKMNKGSFPSSLISVNNSVVCTEPSKLLTQLFNITPSEVHGSSFPPKKCRAASSKCDRCLQHDQCQVNDELERACCLIDCYSLTDCKQATSSQCQQTHVECASGDAYRYTLQPNFQSIRNEFRCHLRRRKQDELYHMWFYVSVPGTGFETPRIYRHIKFDASSTMAEGLHKMEFLTVQHNAGMEQFDELILIGNNYGKQWNYSIAPMNGGSIDDSKQFNLHLLAQNIHMLSAQFSTPFGYSTSSWGNTFENKCQKDITKFVGIKKTNRNLTHDINVITETIRTPFEYLLKSVDNPPHMKFIIPGNVSVIRWWFADKNATLIYDDSFKANLSLINEDRIWKIYLSGFLKDCPGYLGITINDRLEGEEIFKYELLVSCPPTFNLTFFIPNWGVKPEKTFDVTLDDAVTEHHVFLTNVLLEDLQESCSINSSGIYEPNNSNATLPIWIALSLLSGLILCMVVHVSAERGNKMIVEDEGPRSFQTKSTSDGCLHPFKAKFQLTRPQKTMLFFYVTLQIVYSCLFTFTSASVLFSFCLRSDSFDKDGRIHADIVPSVYNKLELFEEHVMKEFQKQTRLVSSIQMACNDYIEDLVASVWRQIDKSTHFDKLEEFYGNEYSISSVISELFNSSLIEFQEELDAFTLKYNENVENELWPFFSKYKMQVESILSNDWFLYPRNLFNRNEAKDAEGQNLSQESFHLSSDQLQLSRFLEFQNVEMIHTWRSQFLERFESLRWSYFANPSSIPSTETCSHDDTARVFHQRNFAAEDLYTTMNSSRYYATDYGVASTDNKETNIPSHDNSSQCHPLRSDDGSCLDHRTFHWDIFKIVFLAMDVLLLIFRLCHTIVNARKMCYGFQVKILLTVDDLENLNQQIEARSTAVNGSEHFQTMDSQNHVDVTPENSTEVMMSSSDDALNNSTIDIKYGLIPSNNHFNIRSEDSSLSQKILVNSGNNSLKLPLPPIAKLNRQIRASPWKQLWRTVIKVYIHSLTGSELLPKTVLVLVILFSLQLILRSADYFFHKDFFLSFIGNVPQLFNIHLNNLNQYLDTTVTIFSDELLSWYKKHSTQELSHLKTIYDYFHTEQDAYKRDYSVQICSLQNFSSNPNSTCDIRVDQNSSRPLRMPLLPCNFLLTRTKFFSECAQNPIQDHPAADGLNSTFLLITTASNILLIGLLIIVTFNVSNILFLHVAKTCQLFRIHKSYICSSLWPTRWLRDKRSILTGLRLDRQSSNRPAKVPPFICRHNSGKQNCQAVPQETYVICSEPKLLEYNSVQSSVTSTFEGRVPHFSETKV